MADKSQGLVELLKDGGYSIPGDQLAKLSEKVKRRVCALKGCQLKGIEIEAKFYERVHQLEKEFEAEFNKVYDERRKIVTGEYEPTDEECNFPIIHGIEEQEKQALYEKSEPDNGSKGVQGFWLQVLRNAEGLDEMIQDTDEPILEHLIDVTTEVHTDVPGFTIYFYFSKNPYFKNTVLKKRYELQLTPDAECPFDFDGPSVTKSTGDEILWEEGKNVTKKVVKKKAKKGANAGRFLTKTVNTDSFFNFFDPPQPEQKNEDDDEEDAENSELIRADFELGQILRDHVIPRAVLFFTGENDLGDDFDFGGEDGDFDDVSDDEGDE